MQPTYKLDIMTWIFDTIGTYNKSGINPKCYMKEKGKK